MKKIFTSLFLIGLSISSFTQGNWVQKNNFNGNARSRGVAFTIGNNAYYGTGNYFGGSIEQSDFWKYNVATDSWTPIANFPQGMQAGIGMSIGNIGYAGIGWWSGTAHRDFYEYSPSTNTWTAKAIYGGNLTNDAVATSFSSLGYVGLGDQPYSAPLNNDFNQYNPATNTWTTLSNFTGSARRNAIAFEINGILYAGGGQHDSAPHPTDFYKYDIGTNTWTQIASGPTTSATYTRNSAFVVGDNAYLSLNSEFWEYNSITNTWSQFTLPFSGGVDAAFTLNGKGYVVRNNSQEVWEFTPTTTSSNCLIAQYNFSGNAADSSGNGLNGFINGPTLAPDRFGTSNSAYHFDGVDDFIEVSDNALFDFTNNNISVSYWANAESLPTTTGYNNIAISKQSGAGTSQQGFDVWYTNSNAGLRLRAGAVGNFGGASTGSSVNLLQWHHIVYTWDGTTGVSYIDGVLTNSSTAANASIGANNQPLLIGKANWTNINATPFHGWIDDVNIYNCVLTQQEIDSIYNNFSTVGIIEEQISDLIVFPNPANSTLTISNGKGNYKITDVFGRLVKEIKIDNEQVQINIQELQSGIYFLISKENNSSIKFIKQ